VVSEYLPAAHAVHSTALGAEKKPGEQGVHEAAPVVDENVPEIHVKQK
jgi:hypothetical protein